MKFPQPAQSSSIGCGGRWSRSDSRASTVPGSPHLTSRAGSDSRRPANLALSPILDEGTEPAWRLALVESSSHPDGVRYRPLADWPLG